MVDNNIEVILTNLKQFKPMLNTNIRLTFFDKVSKCVYIKSKRLVQTQP